MIHFIFVFKEIKSLRFDFLLAHDQMNERDYSFQLTSPKSSNWIMMNLMLSFQTIFTHVLFQDGTFIVQNVYFLIKPEK